MATRAAFPPGDAREDWAILRALSDVLGERLPLRFAGAAARRRSTQAHPHLLRIGEIAPGDAGRPATSSRRGRQARARAVPRARQRFLSHQSDRARSARDGRVLGARRRPRGRSGGASEDRHGRVLAPTTSGRSSIIVGAERAAARRPADLPSPIILYADRKIWAAVQMRRGPNVVGPWGLFQSFADLLKFVLKEPVIPAGANKGVFLLAPLITCTLALAAWAVIPVNAGWVIANINVGILYIFAISSLGVYGVIMAGWASNSKYPFLAALRSAAQMVSYEVSIGFVIITVLLCVGSLNLTRHRRGAGHGRWRPARLVLAAALADVRDLLRLGAGRDQPAARSTWSRRNRSSSPASWSNTPRRRTCCSCSASTWRSPACARMATILFLGGWLPPFPVPPFTWVPGHHLVRAQGRVRVLHVRHGEGLRAALPLRPADAARLEGVPAVSLAMVVDRRRRARTDWRREA